MLQAASALVNSIEARWWLVLIFVGAGILYTAMVAVNMRRSSQAIPIDDAGAVTQQNTVKDFPVYGDINQHNENETKLEQIDRQLPSGGGLFPNLRFNVISKIFSALVKVLTKRGLTWLLATGIFLSVFGFLGGIVSGIATYAPESFPLPSIVIGFDEMLPLASIPFFIASALQTSGSAASFATILLLMFVLIVGTTYFSLINKASCVECGRIFGLRSQKVVDDERVDRGDVVYSGGQNERRITSDFVKGTRLLRCKECGTAHIANTGRIETHGSGYL
jgi:hypothetical protein